MDNINVYNCSFHCIYTASIKGMPLTTRRIEFDFLKVSRNCNFSLWLHIQPNKNLFSFAFIFFWPSCFFITSTLYSLGLQTRRVSVCVGALYSNAQRPHPRNMFLPSVLGASFILYRPDLAVRKPKLESPSQSVLFFFYCILNKYIIIIAKIWDRRKKYIENSSILIKIVVDGEATLYIIQVRYVCGFLRREANFISKSRAMMFVCLVLSFPLFFVCILSILVSAVYISLGMRTQTRNMQSYMHLLQLLSYLRLHVSLKYRKQ